MSKEDFSPTEFEQRHTRVRSRMAELDLEVLIVIAPTNIQYLIGSRTKSYQAFQCLLFPLDPTQPKVVLTRLAEVFEYRDLSLADDVHGWAGREPQPPVDALAGLLRREDYLQARVGLETPPHYLSVDDARRLEAVLREASVTDASGLVEDLKLVKSPAEIEYIRRAASIANAAMGSAAEAMVAGATECEVAGAVYHDLLALGGDSPASPLNLVSGERCCFAHGRPPSGSLAPAIRSTSSSGPPIAATPAPSVASCRWVSRRLAGAKCMPSCARRVMLASS